MIRLVRLIRELEEKSFPDRQAVNDPNRQLRERKIGIEE
jgi:hypothetical protein